MTSQRKIVIYTRFSSDMQSPKSYADQEREVREALAKMGIDHTDAVVIHDEAESGTLRDEFSELKEMVKRKEIHILAVDDQARLARDDSAFGFIIGLACSGGRFISTGEGIDTSQLGGEVRIRIDEEKAKSIRWIFDCLNGGWSINEIVRELNRQGSSKSPRRKSR